MSAYVLLIGGEVFEQIETDGDISKMYHSSMVWVCTDGIEPPPSVGWKTEKVDGEWQFSAPDAVNVTPEQLAETVAAERFAREGTGVTVRGLAVETTRDSQALIASTGLSAVLDPEYRCNFKTMTGFVEIGSAQIIAIAKAVRAHVQACFDRELTLLRAIEAGEYHEDMLSEGWPNSSPPDPADLQ
ncbi:DUF4376 domain-containing protein [Pseudomonas sp. A-RE-19]|uniref:DUF4376 domain-containing protein n=1 Tax=Pseudomonas sp. A-RE-19 TaxID=2832401 RepID=UPI001CC0D22E|nr:DUF4376 domain-containing protein [Pseudomonas sp. A-RE-19]